MSVATGTERAASLPASTLPPEAFRRYDESDDRDFYSIPRLVTHIDDRAIEAVTNLYRELLPANGAILDLMSSWVSHLPAEVTYSRVVGLGMNEPELRANPRLDDWTVQDLNADPLLPFADDSFDGCGVCVSVQYLTRPVEVFREVARVCRKGAPFVITFSNRCFPTKAVAVWQMLSDQDHLRLVAHYLDQAGDWEQIESRIPLAPSPKGDPLFAVIAHRK